MANAERINPAEEQTRVQRQRSVPVDWFLDPADPAAQDRFDAATSLDDAATAFLTSHEVSEASDELEAELAPITRIGGAEAPSAAEQSTPWLPLGTFLGAEDEGELAWQTEALCAQTDPEAFFPEKGGSTRDAKKVCSSCTVRADCLEYALKNDERFGIWGGMSERERRRLRKRAI